MSGEGSSFSTTTLHRLSPAKKKKKEETPCIIHCNSQASKLYGNLPKSHFKNAIDQFDCDDICITTVDSDIAIYSLYFQSHFPATHIFLKIGTGTKRRILDIKEMSSKIGIKCCDALPALHAFTGNDYTSAFHGVGKVKSYKQMLKSPDFLKVFKEVGDSFSYQSNFFSAIEQFVCCLYWV